MIRHLVMWRVKESAMGMDKAALVAEMKRRLEALPAQIPQIRFFQVGVNVVPSERACDLALVSDFESLEALQAYAKHPKHLEVVDFVLQAVSEGRAVDFQH
jgi:hypothetical protein